MSTVGTLVPKGGWSPPLGTAMIITESWMNARRYDLNKEIADARSRIAGLETALTTARAEEISAVAKLEELSLLERHSTRTRFVRRTSRQKEASRERIAELVLGSLPDGARSDLVNEVIDVLLENPDGMGLKPLTELVNQRLGSSYSRFIVRPIVMQTCTLHGVKTQRTYMLRDDLRERIEAAEPALPEDDGDK